MKVDFVAAAVGMASLAAAAPADQAPRIEERQLFGGGGKFELTKGACKEVTFIWARGTTEAVNIVWFSFQTHVVLLIFCFRAPTLDFHCSID
jgi:hypothetical protein